MAVIPYGNLQKGRDEGIRNEVEFPEGDQEKAVLNFQWRYFFAIKFARQILYFGEIATYELHFLQILKTKMEIPAGYFKICSQLPSLFLFWNRKLTDK